MYLYFHHHHTSPHTASHSYCFPETDICLLRSMWFYKKSSKITPSGSVTDVVFFSQAHKCIIQLTNPLFLILHHDIHFSAPARLQAHRAFAHPPGKKYYINRRACDVVNDLHPQLLYIAVYRSAQASLYKYMASSVFLNDF